MTVRFFTRLLTDSPEMFLFILILAMDAVFVVAVVVGTQPYF